MSFELCLAPFTLSSLCNAELKAGRRSSEPAMEKWGQLGLQVLQFDLAEDIITGPKISLQANPDTSVFYAVPCTYLNRAEKYLQGRDFMQVYGLHLASVGYTSIDHLRAWPFVF